MFWMKDSWSHAHQDCDVGKVDVVTAVVGGESKEFNVLSRSE